MLLLYGYYHGEIPSQLLTRGQNLVACTGMAEGALSLPLLLELDDGVDDGLAANGSWNSSCSSLPLSLALSLSLDEADAPDSDPKKERFCFSFSFSFSFALSSFAFASPGFDNGGSASEMPFFSSDPQTQASQ